MDTSFITREHFRKVLPTLRIIAGLKSEDLAEMLEVTRQTARNLERGITPLTVAYYIAIKCIIEDVACNNGIYSVSYILRWIMIEKEDLINCFAEECNKIIRSNRRGGISAMQMALQNYVSSLIEKGKI